MISVSVGSNTEYLPKCTIVDPQGKITCMYDRPPHVIYHPPHIEKNIHPRMSPGPMGSYLAQKDTIFNTLAGGEFVGQVAEFFVLLEKGNKPMHVVVHNKLADVCCQHLSMGRKVDMVCETVRTADGEGNVNISYRLKNITFMEEHWIVIESEIHTGHRPYGWNDLLNNQAKMAWKAYHRAINHEEPNYKSKQFRHAVIVLPKYKHTLVNPNSGKLIHN